jgi:hypothetical protein
MCFRSNVCKLMLYFVWKMKCYKNVILQRLFKTCIFLYYICYPHKKKNITVILPVGLYGCETWCWGRHLGLKRNETVSLEENAQWCASCYAVTKHYGSYIQEGWDWWGTWHVRETGELHLGFWRGNPKETNHLEDVGIDGRITVT